MSGAAIAGAARDVIARWRGGGSMAQSFLIHNKKIDMPQGCHLKGILLFALHKQKENPISMNTIKINLSGSTILASTAALLLLSACGGGGDTSTPIAAPPVATLSQISAGNSVQVASSAYATNSSLGNSLAGTSALLIGVSVDGAAPGIVVPVFALVKRAYANGAPALLTGISVTRACAGGGSIVVSAPGDRPNGPINGDNLSFAASHCVEAGISINGALTMAFSNVSGNLFGSGTGSGVGTATINTTFNDVSIVQGTTADIVTGDVKLIKSQSSAGNLSLAISGTSLQVVELNAGLKVLDLRMSDYAFAIANSGKVATVSANYTLAGTFGTLGQASFTVRTLQPFVSSGNSSPSAGALAVNDTISSVTATVLPANKVRIDYSAKGDGTITQANTLDWVTFAASR